MTYRNVGSHGFLEEDKLNKWFARAPKQRTAQCYCERPSALTFRPLLVAKFSTPQEVMFYHNYNSSEDVLRNLYNAKYPDLPRDAGIQRLLRLIDGVLPVRLLPAFHFGLHGLFHKNVQKNQRSNGRNASEYIHNDSG